MLHNIPTVTVGIPYHNETESIIPLLESILNQEQKIYELKEIVIVTDGCIEADAQVIRDFSINHPQVSLIYHNDRKGKAARLNEIYQYNTSDFLVTFDADVAIKDQTVLKRMVMKFNHENVAMVGANAIPVKPTMFSEALVYHIYNLYNYLHQNNSPIHLIRGCALALRGSFAKQISFPDNIISEKQYLFFQTTKYKYKIRIVKDALVYYLLPQTMDEYVVQNIRSSKALSRTAELFGSKVVKQYRIARLEKFKRLIKACLYEPFFTPLAIVYYLIKKRQYKNRLKETSHLWSTARTTKRLIRL